MGQAYLICVLGVGVGEVRDVKAQFLIGCHHGQGLEMHIAGHAVLGHLCDDIVALLHAYAGDADQIEMIVSLPVLLSVSKALYPLGQQKPVINFGCAAAAGDRPSKRASCLRPKAAVRSVILHL